jgi:xanthine dehydrogenase accessory factor
MGQMVIHHDSFAPGPAQSDWPFYGLVDDVRPALAELFARGEKGALVTLVAVDGPSPRPLGSQMLIDQSGAAVGYVSGGCVEGSLVILAQEVMASSKAQSFVFGADSPFMDIALICGTQIEVLIEPANPDDPGLMTMLAAFSNRQVHQRQSALNQFGISFSQAYVPAYRLIIMGHDPVALACISLAKTMGFEAILVRDKGPSQPVLGLAGGYFNTSAKQALGELKLDPWTAMVTTTHDLDQDHEALCLGLNSNALYVGALGSKRRLEDRITKLRAEGLSDAQIARLRAPVGLAIGAATPYEIALSILGDIVATRRGHALP